MEFKSHWAVFLMIEEETLRVSLSMVSTEDRPSKDSVRKCHLQLEVRGFPRQQPYSTLT